MTLNIVHEEVLPQDPYVTAMDERLVFQDKENYQSGNVFEKQNLLYQAN